MIRRRIQEGLLDPKYTSWPDVTLRPNFYVAVTALSAAALLEWRENAPGPIDRALAKAEAYLDDDSRIAIGRCEECFAETFRLLYFTKKGDVTRMNRIVARLARLQDRDGFWGHEYPSAFATAGVVHVLVLSRKAGAELPEALLRRAADALLKTRRDGGRQDYRHEAGKPQSSEKNSAGRTAMCELALHECGHGSLENVAAGVDAYWKHLGKLEAVRVCDNHADEELAGFFFYYDVFHTLEAARALAEPARAEHVRKFRSQVLSLPEIDGSFVDSHELGKSYGTAMALLILGRVRDTAVEQELTVLSPEDRPRKMLNTWLVAESEKLFAERRKALAALKTPVDVRKRQEDLRAKFLEVLGGFPERTPLHPRITGTLQRDGYHIEKVIYEVRPDHHVTANFYLPEGKGPFPGVLFPLGHYDNPKPAEEYQRTCILLAKNGIAALTYDPIGQGERYQLLDPDGKPRARGTSEHTLSDVGALLVGTCSAQYFVWEGIRGLDYLASRPEIDPKRLGCMGNSGGGTMTAYLMALDERVACAVPNCFITSMEKLYATVGPQDGEACLRSLVAAGMGHSDFFLLRAPRPSQLSCPTRDYYDIEGAWSTFREAKQIYAILGHAERMDLFEFDDKHSISKPFREAAVRWMRRWLLGVDDAIVETAGPIEKPEDLQCTSSGHVVREFKERTTYDFTADREKALASKRTVRSREDLEREVRRLIAVPDAIRPATLVVDKGDVARRGYRIRKVVFETDPGIRIPALQFVHEAAKETARILYVHGDGKSKEAQPGGAIERLVRAGHTVTAIDLRGMGETEPEPPHRGLVNFVKADWKEAYISFNMSRPLLGQRVRDLLSVAAALIEDGSGIQVMAVGAAAPVALHAAFLDPRLRSVTLEGMVVSWSAVARTPVTINQLTNVVPCALEVYDLPDLAAALAPRPLTIRSAADPAGSPVARGVLGETYQAARSAYADRGVPSALVLEDGGLDR
jgi:pimeloyl-ACP methyl ester carboxylesterase